MRLGLVLLYGTIVILILLALVLAVYPSKPKETISLLHPIMDVEAKELTPGHYQLNSGSEGRCGALMWKLNPTQAWRVSCYYRIVTGLNQGDVGDMMWIGCYRPLTTSGCHGRPRAGQSTSSGWCVAFDVYYHRVDLYYGDQVIFSKPLTYDLNTPQPTSVECDHGHFRVFYNGENVLDYTDPNFSSRPEVTKPDVVFEIGGWCGGATASHEIHSLMISTLSTSKS
jgi:hypothetical protein